MAKDVMQDRPGPAAPVRDSRSTPEKQLDLLERTSTAIHDEGRTSDALGAAIRLIAEHNGWRIGHVYRRRGTPPRAVQTRIWYDDADVPSPSPLRQSVRSLQSTLGVEMATRVLESEEPLWMDGLDQHPRVAGTGLPLRVLAMFPVMTSARTVAVLEFFADRGARPDPAFMRVMRVVGIQLGYLIERNVLQQRLARVALEQQKEIALELHDTVGQEATAMGILARMLHKDLAERAAPETELAVRLMEGVQRLKLRIRDFLSFIGPMDVDPRALRDHLEELAQRYATLGNCACVVEVDDTVAVTDAFAATKILRIAREAVHNAVKHGKPRNIRVTFRQEDEDAAVLEIVDDGTGADVASLARGGGLGQRSMHYRADLLFADLDVLPEPGGGVRVRCRIPTESLSADADEEGES